MRPATDDYAEVTTGKSAFMRECAVFQMLFISYSTKNEHRASSIVRMLQNVFYSAFLAKERLRPSERYIASIHEKLANCDAVIAVVTEAFNKSAFCQQEVGFAVACRKPIVPVLVGRALPCAMIASVQGVRQAKLVATIHSLASLRQMRIRIWTERTGEAASFKEADRLLDQFKKEWSHMDHAQCRAWVRTAGRNSQVTGANYGIGSFYRSKLAEVRKRRDRRRL